MGIIVNTGLMFENLILMLDVSNNPYIRLTNFPPALFFHKHFITRLEA